MLQIVKYNDQKMIKIQGTCWKRSKNHATIKAMNSHKRMCNGYEDESNDEEPKEDEDEENEEDYIEVEFTGDDEDYEVIC